MRDEVSWLILIQCAKDNRESAEVRGFYDVGVVEYIDSAPGACGAHHQRLRDHFHQNAL